MRNYTFKIFPVGPGVPNRGPAGGFSPKKPAQESSLPAEKVKPGKEEPKEIPAVPQEPCPVPPGPPGMMPPCPPSQPIPQPPQTPFLMPPVSPVPGIPPVEPYPFIPGYPFAPGRLAHSYVPWQTYNVVYSPSEALDKGTLFPELFQPQGVYGPCEGPQPCRMYFPWGGEPYGIC